MNSKISLLHIDDQAAYIEQAQKMLQSFPDVQYLGSADNAEDGLAKWTALQPDIILLDINLPGKDGFWLADKIKNTNTSILFLTSFPDHALKAFDVFALHYLIKPLTKKALASALERHQKKQTLLPEQDYQAQQVADLMETHLNDSHFPKRIFINNLHLTTIINLEDVLYISAAGSYTIFATQDGKKHTSSKLLKIYEDALEHHPDFVRIHRAHIVNKQFTKGIIREKHKIAALMTDETELEVSPQKRDTIYDLLA